MHLRPGSSRLAAAALLLATASAEPQSDAAPAILPSAIRKMGLDGGEKFLAEYYAFAELSTTLGRAVADFSSSHLLDAEADLLAANSSAVLPFRAAFAPHRDDSTSRGWEVLARLQKRQWGCPVGTTSCEGIGHPYSCCHEGTTCYKIADTGLGPVGCCARGQTCGGEITSCGAKDLACPADLGGGCCIAGYVCQGVGCVKSSTAVAPSPPPVQPTTFTTTSTSTISGPNERSTVVVTVIVTQTPSEGVTTRTTTQTTTPKASSDDTPSSTGGVAPVKPTLTASSDQTAAPTTPASYCPTGYYGCLATAGGGCCQTGRDCQTTSCPPVASTTIVTNGATIVVPASDVPSRNRESSTCAGGWFLCPASAGPVPGCCPSGYECGTASCSVANPSGTGTTEKKLPSGGAELGLGGVQGLVLGMALPVLVGLMLV